MTRPVFYIESIGRPKRPLEQNFFSLDYLFARACKYHREHFTIWQQVDCMFLKLHILGMCILSVICGRECKYYREHIYHLTASRMYVFKAPYPWHVVHVVRPSPSQCLQARRPLLQWWHDRLATELLVRSKVNSSGEKWWRIPKPSHTVHLIWKVMLDKFFYCFSQIL